MIDSTESASGDEPLIGVDGLTAPEWAAGSAHAARAGWWRTVAAAPAAAVAVAVLAWRTAPVATVLAVLVELASGVATAFGLLATAGVLTHLLAAGPTPQRVVAALPSIVLVLAAYAARALLQSVVGAVQAVLTPTVELAARDAANEAVLGVELAAFDDTDFVELIRQGNTHGVPAIETSVTQLADLLSSLVALVAGLVAVGVLNPLLAPAVALAAVADGVTSMIAAKLRYRHHLATVSRHRQRWVVDDLINRRDPAAEVRAFTVQDALLAEHRRIARRLAREDIRHAHRETRVRLVGRAAAGLGTALAYCVLGLLLYSGRMPLALAGAATVAMRTASSSLASTMYMINGLYANSFYIALYRTLLAEAGARRRRGNALGPGAAAAQAPPADPDRIRLERVGYTYPGQDEPAVRDISLTLHRGEVVALVGENGSGKSTLARLITGLYLPTAGRVCWDEVDTADADPVTLQGNVAVIMQEPARWPMTARNNVRIGRLAAAGSEGARRYAEALRESGADEVIADLPLGERTVLSRQFREGKELSGGQWQRMGVARGIYRDAPVLVADEPTAALDARAEHAVFRALQSASRAQTPAVDGAGRRTTVLVTHRLANIRHVDRIIVLHQGRIVEQGTHAELMAAAGLYAELFLLQARPYSEGMREGMPADGTGPSTDCPARPAAQ
jgi:ATP-binding cassette subfamily B protein